MSDITPVHECVCRGDEQGNGKEFWCESHQCWKPPHYHMLCRDHERWRQAWNEGIGPGQRPGGVSQPAKPGLGDKIGDALAAIGITEENYKAVKQIFGLPPKCNCAGRKEWLNKVGRWLKGEK